MFSKIDIYALFNGFQFIIAACFCSWDAKKKQFILLECYVLLDLKSLYKTLPPPLHREWSYDTCCLCLTPAGPIHAVPNPCGANLFPV